MLILSTTTDKIQVVLSGNVATTQLKCYAAYNDTTTTSITPGRNATLTNNTTAVDLVSSPPGSTQRLVSYLSVYNSDTANATVTVNVVSTSTSYPVFSSTLMSGDKLEYQQGDGFKIIGSGGSIRMLPSQSGPNLTSNLQYAYVSADLTTNTTTYIDITGLSFPVKAGKRYYFNFIIPYTSSQTFNGIKFSVNGPTNSYLAYYSVYPSSTTAVTYNNGLSGYDLPSAVVSNTSLIGIVKLEGIVYATADGTLIGRYAGEAGANNIAAKKGAVVFYSELN